jgi:predicted house-cleaning noncanonical NTP pyrophosphatase (MazG superfamily)
MCAVKSTPSRADIDVTQGADAESLARDEVFEILRNRRRRFVLHYLKQRQSAPIDLAELSNQVAAWENDKPVDELTYNERKTVQNSLYQFHLEKMQDFGVVEYDRRSGEVLLTAAAADLDLYLEAVPEEEIPWSLYFVGLSVLATLLAGGVWLDVWFLAAVPATGWFLLASLAFLISSAAFFYQNRYRMRIGSKGAPPEVTDR